MPAIAFPAFDPVLFEWGPLVIRWYALAYIAGIVLGWRYAVSLIRQPALFGFETHPVTEQTLDDFVLWTTLGVVLGGRMGYVLFYNLPLFMEDPLEIFKVWHGGMSFHGGMLGVILAIMLFARRAGLDQFRISDLVACAVPFGLFFGRIANFINGELWGRAADVPWAMVFPHGGPDPRHPSQLYQALLEGILLFILLRVAGHRFGLLKKRGAMTGLFLIGYGIARLIGELFREPDAQLGYLWGGLTMGMLLSIPMLVAGIIFMRLPAESPAKAS
jgi:phosphatidylglycerol:prolipoprotein diacylglycerol transferase